MIFAVEVCRARSLQYGKAPPHAIKATLTAANAGLDSAGSPPAVSTAPRVALARCSLCSLWGCFSWCSFLLVVVPSLFGSSSAGVPVSGPLGSSSAVLLPPLVSCGVFGPPVLGGVLLPPRLVRSSLALPSLFSPCAGLLPVRPSLSSPVLAGVSVLSLAAPALPLRLASVFVVLVVFACRPPVFVVLPSLSSVFRAVFFFANRNRA